MCDVLHPPWKKQHPPRLFEHPACFSCNFFALEAEDSNEAPSSEEDQDLVDFNPDLNIKQSRRTISQIIKDKKKQTLLTLQWWVQTHQ